MSEAKTYGLTFPFKDSNTGKYFDLTTTDQQEIRSNLIHLLLTRKGSRYFLPDFGTRLYEYIFEQMDGPTFSDIESEIRQSVEIYLPNLTITNIQITDASDEGTSGSYVNANGEKTFRVSNVETKEHTAKVKIDYLITSSAFASNDFVIINI